MLALPHSTHVIQFAPKGVVPTAGLPGIAQCVQESLSYGRLSRNKRLWNGMFKAELSNGGSNGAITGGKSVGYAPRSGLCS